MQQRVDENKWTELWVNTRTTNPFARSDVTCMSDSRLSSTLYRAEWDIVSWAYRGESR